MEQYQIGVIVALLAVSVVAVVAPLIAFCIGKVVRKPSYGAYNRSSVTGWLFFSAFLIVAVWCLRYAVGYFSVVTALNGSGGLNWFEELLNSLVHALQTFSMDEDYTTYILNGKQMLSTLFGADSVTLTIYGAYASILNLAAPIAGGAILFEIIASVFPKIRLWLDHFAVWREKYYFSELNDASLAMAQSVFNANRSFFKKPVIIFTDAYVDDKDEKCSERLLEAKALGAICVRDDLSHVKKNRFGRRKFFLIDEAESGNLQTLADLANSDNNLYLKCSEIYLFTNDDAYIQVENRVRELLERELKLSEEEMPIFVPVQSYRNLISNMLVDVPLYEPLIGKKRDRNGNQSLAVTILGTGHIGTEMFLTTYWLGQILDCELTINVLSQESEADFWSKIDYVNPEIRHTTIKNDPILRINRKGDMADVYCRVNYLQCDVKSSDFVDCLREPEKRILDTDYFLVALGSDEDNISVANTVRKYVGQYHIKRNEWVKTVIAYVVYDSGLSKTLNGKRFYSFVNGKVDVYMQAIGSLHDVYSVRNVFLTDFEPFEMKIVEAYAAIQNREKRAKTHRDRLKDDYKHWADLARGMHLKYKVYSMGMISESLFDYPEEPHKLYEKLTKNYETYKRVVSGNFEFDSPDHETEHLQLLHRMAWLEHRRWNAFTRVKGFRSTTDYDVYAVPGEFSSYKQLDIKLHPCLVECDQTGIKARISSKGIIDTASLFQCQDRDGFDLLDELSYDLYSKRYCDYDFKQHDYPISTI